MEYIANRTAYSITGMPISRFQGMSYESQREMYEGVVRYSRIPPKGAYMNGGNPPKI